MQRDRLAKFSGLAPGLSYERLSFQRAEPYKGKEAHYGPQGGYRGIGGGTGGGGRLAGKKGGGGG